MRVSWVQIGLLLRCNKALFRFLDTGEFVVVVLHQARQHLMDFAAGLLHARCKSLDGLLGGRAALFATGDLVAQSSDLGVG